MSVQFGKCDFDGGPVDLKDLDQVRPMLAPYGPDGEGYICKDNLGVLYRAFHTTKESRSEVQPHVSTSGAVITWDGRLDNREELMDQLKYDRPGVVTDLAIIAMAYEHWGTDSFRKLLGDWALSVWDPRDHSLVLAKDFAGARHLYYSSEKNEVTWCTILDPLVLFARHSFELDEEYIAGWLSFSPAADLTPYVGIHSVPPSCFVRLINGGRTITKYWNFDPATQIRYRTDSEYEDHFRFVFSESVRRRLRSDRPIVGELSGGMDSSSIVCMADTLIKRGVGTPRLDTVSFCDDSEPNWNERPYIAKVEEQRRQTSNTIDVSSREYFTFDYEGARFTAAPGFTARDKASEEFAACILSRDARVVLSGIGGDEILGGVPTPIPELADLLAAGRLMALAHRLKIWALTKRQPWAHLFFEVAREFLPFDRFGAPTHMRPAVWLDLKFVKSHREALRGYEPRLRLLVAAPSFQENLFSIGSLRRQLAAVILPSAPTYERRYPYLDRALIEFVLAIPRDQLVRPGERRSLMRRALRGIVPEDVLNRRRKAYVIRAPLRTIAKHSAALERLADGMVCSRLGIMSRPAYLTALRQVGRDHVVPLVQLIRTVNLECWLRGVTGGTSGAFSWAFREQKEKRVREPCVTANATKMV